LVVLLAAGAGSPQTASPEYATIQAFALQQKENGIAGTLELFLDRRLSRSVQDQLWGKGNWSFVFPPDSNLYRQFSNRPPVNARLRIADRAGKVVASRDLQTTLAKLQEWNPSTDSNQVFLLTQDHSAGFGSYSGLGTTLFMVSGSAFREVKAFNTESGQEVEIRLAKSLKSDWRIMRRGDKAEILSISCHPKSHSQFVIDYARYSFDGEKCLVYKREAEGVWESDDPFPKRSVFP
jgi:hypothetical protein